MGKKLWTALIQSSFITWQFSSSSNISVKLRIYTWFISITPSPDIPFLFSLIFFISQSLQCIYMKNFIQIEFKSTKPHLIPLVILKLGELFNLDWLHRVTHCVKEVTEIMYMKTLDFFLMNELKIQSGKSLPVKYMPKEINVNCATHPKKVSIILATK